MTLWKEETLRMKDSILVIVGCFLLAIALNALEAFVIAKLICFIFALTYTTILFLKIWAALIIIQTILGYVGRRN